MNPLAATFDALADPTRLAVLRLLAREPHRSGDLAAALATSRPAMSRHLRVLRHAGLVEEHALASDARGRVYALRPEPFDEVRAFLHEVDGFWTDQLGAFKAHVEGA